MLRTDIIFFILLLGCNAAKTDKMLKEYLPDVSTMYNCFFPTGVPACFQIIEKVF